MSDAPLDPAADAPLACPLPAQRKGLRRREWIELGVIALALPALWFATRDLLWSPRFGALVAYCAALFLGQGLVRDVARLLVEGRKTATQKMLCMCAETSVGVVALVAGLALLGIGLEERVTLTGNRLTALAAALLAFGFVAKDYVLVLRRVEDHGTISVG